MSDKRNSVIIYTKENCLLCDDAMELLNRLQLTYNFEVIERDIHSNDEWLMDYQLMIPVVVINEQINFGAQLEYVALGEQLEKMLHP